MQEISRLLAGLAGGEARAAEQLLPLLYDELRPLADRNLAAEAPGQTLQATALVHEAYLRLVGDQQFESRGHFFAAAAQAMRRILVENASRKKRLRHGGGRDRVELDEAHHQIEPPGDEVLQVDEALEAFDKVDPQAAAVVKLHFFAGLPLAEAAEVLGVSERTAYRDWAYARAWLARFLGGAKNSAE
ncbi:MAG: ECF-type sigma factor [Gemmataceae bacterium]